MLNSSLGRSAPMPTVVMAAAWFGGRSVANSAHRDGGALGARALGAIARRLGAALREAPKDSVIRWTGGRSFTVEHGCVVTGSGGGGRGSRAVQSRGHSRRRLRWLVCAVLSFGVLTGQVGVSAAEGGRLWSHGAFDRGAVTTQLGRVAAPLRPKQSNTAEEDRGTIRFDPSLCRENPGGVVTIAAGRTVLQIPVETLGYIRDSSLERRAMWPAPPDPTQPEGCPDHPIDGGGFNLVRGS